MLGQILVPVGELCIISDDEIVADVITLTRTAIPTLVQLISSNHPNLFSAPTHVQDLSRLAEAK